MAALLLGFSYLLGSLPFGYILSKVIHGIDIREYGSRNIGATNVLRVLGWRSALPVFILDLAKGLFAVLLTRAYTDTTALYLAAGFLAMLGHSFSIFFGFRGGKAMATAIGVLIATAGWITLIVIAVFLLVVRLTRFVSLGTMIAICTAPLLYWLFGFSWQYILLGLGMALLVIGRHHENIGRLLQGKESKLGKKVNPVKPPARKG